MWGGGFGEGKEMCGEEKGDLGRYGGRRLGNMGEGSDGASKFKQVETPCRMGANNLSSLVQQ